MNTLKPPSMSIKSWIIKRYQSLLWPWLVMVKLFFLFSLFFPPFFPFSFYLLLGVSLRIAKGHIFVSMELFGIRIKIRQELNMNSYVVA